MSQLTESLRRRNAALQAECDALAGAIDQMTETQGALMARLKIHDPEFIGQLTGDSSSETSTASPETAAEPSKQVTTLQ